MAVRTLFLALSLLASGAQSLLAGPLQDDLKARRARMMERLTPQIAGDRVERAHARLLR